MRLKLALLLTSARAFTVPFPGGQNRDITVLLKATEEPNPPDSPPPNDLFPSQADDDQSDDTLSPDSPKPFFVEQMVSDISAPSTLEISLETETSSEKDPQDADDTPINSDEMLEETIQLQADFQDELTQSKNENVIDESISENIAAGEVVAIETDMEVSEVNPIISEERREELLKIQEQTQELLSKATNTVGEVILEELLKPLFSSEIEKSVPVETIKGAAIAGASISLLTSKGIALSGAAAASAAYLAITPGKGGASVRSIGKTVWNSANAAVDLYRQSKIDKLLSAVLVKVGSSIREGINEKYDIELPEIKSAEIESETQAQNLVEKKTLKSGDTVERSPPKIDEQILTEKVQEGYEDPEIAELLSDVEDAVSQAEAEINRLNGKVEKEASESGDVEEKNVSKIEEQIEAEKVQEEDSVLVDERSEQENEAVLAEEPSEEPQEYNNDDSAELSLEDLAAQAREAVELFEANRLEEEVSQDTDNDEVNEEAWATSPDFEIELEKQLQEYDSDDSAESSLEDLAAQAREAVELFEAAGLGGTESVEKNGGAWVDLDIDEPTDQELEELSEEVARLETNAVDKDWSLLTVTHLKAELKLRGLKSSGRKAELVAALQESDREFLIEQTVQYEDSTLGSESGLELELNTSDDAPSTDDNIEAMNISQLKDELRRRGLKVGGRKADLIERLMSV